MIYNFNVKVKEINGQDVSDGRTMANVMSEFIGSETKGDTVKMCYWYGTLMSQNSLDLDEPDKNKLIELISTSERLMMFLKHQLLEVLNKPITQ